MLKKFAAVATGCFAIGSLILGTAEVSARQGGVHIGGGGFGGHFGGGFEGHFGGIARGPAGGIGSTAPPPRVGSFGGGGFRVIRPTPLFGGSGQFGIGTQRFGEVPLRAPRFGVLGTRRNSRIATRTREFGAARSGRSRFSQAEPIERHSITALRGDRRAGPRNRQALHARAPLNTAAFARGNGFETGKFGGHGWRRRDRRFRYYWAGGIFWPYFFGDYFSYAFWPDDYYNPFWAYGSDAILYGALWPYGEYGEDLYAGNPPAEEGAADQYEGFENQTFPEGQISAFCSGFAPGVSALPIKQLEQIIRPTPEQRAAFNELKAAAIKARRVLENSCPDQTPLTPVARLDAMEQRLAAMEQAVTIIRGSLEKLYALLSEAQIQRLETSPAAPEQNPRSPTMNIMELCSSKSGLTNIPFDEIAGAAKLTDEQRFDLNKLRKVAGKAANDLRSSCPTAVPHSLDARLDDAQKRIGALIQAIETIRPAMGAFYASLSSQQKAALRSQGPARRSARR